MWIFALYSLHSFARPGLICVENVLLVTWFERPFRATISDLIRFHSFILSLRRSFFLFIRCAERSCEHGALERDHGSIRIDRTGD
jgi:hypothetical protein